MKIFKYKLNMDEVQTVRMNQGAEILAVQTQGDDICIWAMVSESNPEEERYIRIIGTGHESHIMRKDAYLGTAQMGQFVWHVFEVC